MIQNQSKKSRLKTSFRTSMILLLASISVLIRIPITPHEMGVDSFIFMSISTSITQTGFIFDSLSLVTFFGLVEESYPSGIFTISATVCSVSGLSIQEYAYIHPILFSLFGLFSFWMLLGEFHISFHSRWLSSLSYTLVPAYLYLSSWSLESRYLFSVFLPIFIWIMLKLKNQSIHKNTNKYVLFFLSIWLLLPIIHHMGILTSFIVLLFLLSTFNYRLQENSISKEKIGKYSLLFLFSLSLFILSLSSIGFLPFSVSSNYFHRFLLEGDSILITLINVLFYYLLNFGPLLFLSLLGIFYIFRKNNISEEEYLLIYLLLFCVILSLDRTYIPFVICLFLSILVAFGSEFSFKNFNHTSSSVKLSFCMLVSLSLSFSVLDFTDRLESKESSTINHSLYTRESTLDSSLWIETHYSNSIIESNDRYKLSQITSYSSTSSYDLPFLISNGLFDYRNSNFIFLGFENISYGTKYFWNIDNFDLSRNYCPYSFSSWMGGCTSLSVVNIIFPNESGSSNSINDLSSNSHFFLLNHSTYVIHQNDELSIYWSYNYQ